ncbi:DUF1501 domain-containing protein [Silvibacterium dinghuense]|uniref:DUF1501 domain-containing protein n=1 Tax=Silvibacterium dinghuense TaxID=1560006 RepID=A0A4V1NVC8_9BACT|nr:DUF1501 domain-containing protein [Silvibacterium dinghuense]RXS95320.1 DUF1501 domain-containing protein [Silvibacterium dinghuense]GGH12384.1 Tat pathway signal protein [Silvibacterium dinghuense]
MIDRRKLLQLGLKGGVATATMPLWMRLAGASAYAQSSSSYKAIVCITLFGGNDGNNMIVPLTSATYQQYATLRQGLALSQSALLPVQDLTTGAAYGFHPSLKNVSSLFTQGYASVIANCGPMDQPLTKTLLQENSSLLPQIFGSHPVSIAQWESATTGSAPSTGWGGRIADQISSLSGVLPPVLSVSGVGTFTVGASTQPVTMMQSAIGGAALPSGLLDPTNDIAVIDESSANEIIQHAAALRVSTMQMQNVLTESQTAGSTLKTTFPTSALGQNLQTIAEVINGRSVVGASRQLFYCSTGGYDTHGSQLATHASLLSDFDSSVGAFVAALQEIGMLQNVLILTLSDFGRTMQSNSNAGSDHAWGNHQLVLGGGLTGKRLIGSLPDFDLGGSQDYTGQGVWIPGIATQQIAGAAASWLGLGSSQIANIFPNLSAFSSSTFTL